MKIKYTGNSKNACYFCQSTLSVKYAVDIENDLSAALPMCNRCFATKYSSDKGIEVDLDTGLLLCLLYLDTKLYSDGLQADEYIYYDIDKGFCYEDGAVIGSSINETKELLESLGWINGKRFYLR